MDNSQDIAQEGNTTRTSIGNYSQDDNPHPDGEPYGPTHSLPPGNDNDESPLVHSHVNVHGRRSFSRLLFFDLLITLVVVCLIAVVIRVYEHKGNLTHIQKYAFNTIITGLILILGLSFFVRRLNECFSLGSDCSLACNLPIGGL